MNNTTNAVVGILSIIVGLATVAVLVSPKSNFAAVIGAGGEAFSKVLGAATNPFSK